MKAVETIATKTGIPVSFMKKYMAEFKTRNGGE